MHNCIQADSTRWNGDFRRGLLRHSEHWLLFAGPAFWLFLVFRRLSIPNADKVKWPEQKQSGVSIRKKQDVFVVFQGQHWRYLIFFSILVKRKTNNTFAFQRLRFELRGITVYILSWTLHVHWRHEIIHRVVWLFSMWLLLFIFLLFLVRHRKLSHIKLLLQTPHLLGGYSIVEFGRGAH